MSDEPPARVEVQGHVEPQPLPCPFCGSAEVVAECELIPRGSRHFQHCNGCGARGPLVIAESRPAAPYLAESDARRLWDTRFYRVEAGWTAEEQAQWSAP